MLVSAFDIATTMPMTVMMVRNSVPALTSELYSTWTAVTTLPDAARPISRMPTMQGSTISFFISRMKMMMRVMIRYT